MNSGGSAQVSSHEFADFDEFRELLAGWDLQITQLSRGSLQLRWDQVAFDDMVIGYHRVAGAFADVSKVDQGGRLIVVCLAPTPTVWCGLDLAPGHLVVMGPGREYRSRIEHWESLEIWVADRLASELGLLGGACLPSGLPPERSIVPLDEAYVGAFRALGRKLLSPFALGKELGDELLFAPALRERILNLLRSALEDGAARRAKVAPLQRVPRYDLAIKALQVIDARSADCAVDDDQGGTLAEIAEVVGTTPRAIQYAFRSALGVTPYQYMLARRLNLARHDLRVTGRGRAPVTEAAFDYRFFSLSRFAQQYQRLFGETPSETLARAHTIG